MKNACMDPGRFSEESTNDGSYMEKSEDGNIPQEGTIDSGREAEIDPSEINLDRQEQGESRKKIRRQETEEDFDRKKAIEHIRNVIRTDRSAEKYQRFFGKEIIEPKGKILDLAAGDSNFAETVNKEGDLKVIRCDFGYASDPPKYKEGAVAALAQEMPFADGEFEKVIASYLFEHIPEKDSPKVLAEMLRVTKDGGEIMIVPAYRKLRSKYPFAERKIVANGLIGHIKSLLALEQTLVIRKDSTLTKENWNEAIDDIARSVRLPKLVERWERFWMKLRIGLTGHNKLHR